MSDFPFQRLNINEERSTDKELSERATQTGSLEVPEDEPASSPPLYIVDGFEIVPGSERVSVMPDGRAAVEIQVRWDDQPGAEDYEIWVGEKL